MRFIGRMAVRFRYVVILFWVVAALVSVHFLPQLSSVANGDNGALLPSSAPSQQANQLASPFQAQGGSTAILVVSRANAPLTTADQATITAMEAAIARQPHVIGVRDQGIARDGQARKAQVALDITQTSNEASTVVADIRSAASGVAAPAGLAVNVGGQLATNVDNQAASQRASMVTERLSDLAILIMLLIVYRAALAPLLTLIVPVVSLLISEHVIAQVAASGVAGIQISNVTQTILTVLLLGAGTDYCLFLTLRVFEELQRGLTPAEAVIEAVARVGESIAFSAATVIAALLCLLVASFGVYHGLGPSLAIGVGVTLLAGLTLLPAMLAIFGRAVFWPLKFNAQAQQRPGAWGRIAAQITRRPALTLALGLALFGALAVAALGYAPAGFSGTTTGPTGSDSAAATAAIDAHYPAAVANPTTVLFTFPGSLWANLAPAQQAEQALAGASSFASVSGPLDPNGVAISPQQLATLYARLGPPAALPPVEPALLTHTIPAPAYNAYRAEAQFISADGHAAQYYTTLAAGAPGSSAAMQAMPTARSQVSAIAGEVGATNSGIYGQTAVAYDVSSTSNSDLAHILPLVLALIALLLAFVMRSLVAPLYLVASVALSYAASLGIAVLIFIRAQGQLGLNFVLPFLMFIFLMALGEDYNILVMSRIREEATQRPLREAISRALNATGTTVTSAGLILAATFGVAGAFGATDQVRQLGVGIALGILLDTFLVRTLFVPSVVALLGRWNWWPSALARRPAAVVEAVAVMAASETTGEAPAQM